MTFFLQDALVEERNQKIMESSQVKRVDSWRSWSTKGKKAKGKLKLPKVKTETIGSKDLTKPKWSVMGESAARDVDNGSDGES